jgi:hypothetical protein
MYFQVQMSDVFRVQIDNFPKLRLVAEKAYEFLVFTDVEEL